jgi:hypothetical protein
MPRSKLLRSPYPNGGIQVSKSWYSLGPKITALGRLCTQTNTNAKLGKCPCSSAASVAYPLEFFSAPLFSLLPPHPSAHSLPPPFPLLDCWWLEKLAARPHESSTFLDELLIPRICCARIWWSFWRTCPERLPSSALPWRPPGAATSSSRPWRPQPPSTPPKRLLTSTLFRFARSPARRPLALSHGRGGGHLLPAMAVDTSSSSPPVGGCWWLAARTRGSAGTGGKNILDFFRRRTAGISRKFRFFFQMSSRADNCSSWNTRHRCMSS